MKGRGGGVTLTEIAMTERPMRERKSSGSRIMICVVSMCDIKVGVHAHRGGKVYAEVGSIVSLGSQNRQGWYCSGLGGTEHVGSTGDDGLSYHCHTMAMATGQSKNF